MKLTQNGYDKILRVLRSAYREQGVPPEVAGDWQQNVMRDIRGQAASIEVSADIWDVGQWFWRLAPATCLLIVIFATFLASQDVIPQYEMATLLMDDVVESMYAQELQIL